MEDKKNPFQKASREKKLLRLFLRGVSGSGKTYSALLLAKGLAGKDGKIAVIDTEKGSSTHYTNLCDFDVVDYNAIYDNHKPQNYIDLIDQAQSSGYKVLIIDSLTHAWTGYGGILNINEWLSETKYHNNSFRAWGETTPKYYNPLIAKIILENNMHIIATGRVKSDYAMETSDNGKVMPKKIGLKTEFREGLEYEFDTVLDLQAGQEGLARPEKDRTGVIEQMGEIISDKTVKKFLDYLNGSNKISTNKKSA